MTVKTFFKLKTYQGFQFTAKTYRSDFVNIQREYGNSTETITDVTGHKTGEPRVYTHYMDTGTKIRLRISKSLLDRPYRKDHFSFNNCDARKLQIFSLFFNFVSSSVFLSNAFSIQKSDQWSRNWTLWKMDDIVTGVDTRPHMFCKV